jgi:SAM-dependent methyltransferase
MQDDKIHYPKDFYQSLQEGALRSAREIVPLVLNLVRPGHVIDVGCGSGAWLSVFKENGIDDFQGIDGKWLEPGMLLFPPEHFVYADLEQPIQVGRQFDLVVSLEVAEHLPPDKSEIFIDSLVRLGPVILFSAAVPFQGGTNHLNERWPTYWSAYFESRGYVAIDCLRKRIWSNDQIEWWYAQNILFFIREDHLDRYGLLKAEYKNGTPGPLSLVHPKSVMGRQQQFYQMQLHETELLERIDFLGKEAIELQQRLADLIRQNGELRWCETELLQRIELLGKENSQLRQQVADLSPPGSG